MMDEIVATRALTRGYRMGESTVAALRGVDLRLLRGEFVAVAGVSGSGKSTLLHLIGGLDRPTSGEVWVDGVELGSASEAERTRHRRSRVGFVFQSFNLLPRLTALENAALPLMFAGVPRDERNARARAILEEVGLGHRLHHYPSQLSGGEQQRVAIARALIHDPSLILADEPTGNLDSKTGAEILSLLRRLNQEHGVTVLMVTHDPAAAAAADRTIHLRDGSIERVTERQDRKDSSLGDFGRLEAQASQSAALSPTTASSPAPGPTTKAPVVDDDTTNGHDPNGSTAESAPTPSKQPSVLPSGSLRASDLWRSAFSNLQRRAVRSGLTVLGVFVGIVTIVTMLSIAVGVEQEVQRNVEGVGLETVFVSPPQAQPDPTDPFADPRPTTPITPTSIDTLRRMPEVASIAPLVDLPAYLDLRVESDGHTASATVDSSMTRVSPLQGDVPYVAGRALAPGEARGLILTSRLANDLDVADSQKLIGQKVTLIVRLPRGETNQFPVTVVGVQRDNRRSIQLGVDDAADMKKWWYGQPDLFNTRGYDGLVVKATSLATVGAVEDQVRAMGLQARSLQTFLDLANRIFAMLNALLGSIGGLALLVAALGVTNTMIMAVYERTREIGMLKAIGASRSEVLGLFVAEAGMIGFLGGLLGLVLGALLGRGVDWAGHWYLQSQGVLGVGPLSVVPLWLALGSIAFGTFIGLAAGVYPALRAARLDPVAALRHE